MDHSTNGTLQIRENLQRWNKIKKRIELSDGHTPFMLVKTKKTVGANIQKNYSKMNIVP